MVLKLILLARRKSQGCPAECSGTVRVNYYPPGWVPAEGHRRWWAGGGKVVCAGGADPGWYGGRGEDFHVMADIWEGYWCNGVVWLVDAYVWVVVSVVGAVHMTK